MADKELKEYRKLIERSLDAVLPPAFKEPKNLHRAMRYSVFSGGKRLRPIIVLVTGKLFGVKKEKILPVACGIELIHNFSLIHDDLPAMDDDDFRRGHPTCHKKFGESIALLAGDALLTLGFKIIAESGNSDLVRAAADAIGSEGMAGGQALDITFKNKPISQRLKKTIDEKKTARLFQLCFISPLFFIKSNEEDRRRIAGIARNFGIAFQIRDDMEDREGDAGDLRSGLKYLTERMKKELAYFGKKGRLLLEIIEKLYGFC